MKWNEPTCPYKRNERRIVNRFLWWPVCINGEWRWMERASIEQRWTHFTSAGDPTGCMTTMGWLSERWFNTGDVPLPNGNPAHLYPVLGY